MTPGYEQKTFPEAERHGQLRLIGSRDVREGSVRIQQDVDLFATFLSNGERLSHTIRSGRGVWIQVARGEMTVNGQSLQSGDGMAILSVEQIELEGPNTAEALVFDMAV
jgi:redox-sensitive bicupin YhaK (pirin superfamily)